MDDRRSGSLDEGIGGRVADQQIVARAAHQRALSLSGDNDVVPVAAGERIIAALTEDQVVFSAAGDGVISGAASDGDRAGKIHPREVHGDCVAACAARNGYAPNLARLEGLRLSIYRHVDGLSVAADGNVNGVRVGLIADDF